MQRKRVRLIALFGVTFVFIVLLTFRSGSTSDSNSSLTVHSGRSVVDANSPGKESSGPTMIMSYRKDKYLKNPIDSFMYFIALIAPTLVDSVSSVNNQQHMGIISHETTVDSKSFSVICDFEILGSGFYMNTFDSAGMIAAHADEVEQGETMTHMLDYIRVEGQGFGIIEVTGTIADSTWTVTEVDIQFNAKGHESPVTIGLYDIEARDGEYGYENRSNEQVARINRLSFEKTEKTPRMGMKIASIAKKSESAGFLGRIKGLIVNVFLRPTKVDKLGNTTMIEFGNALLQQDPTFTFPKAKNLKESNVVRTDHIHD